MQLEVINIRGEKVGKTVELPKEIFGLELGGNHEHVVYLAVKQYMANQRQGTHKSKQRNEISGSTRKLHKQKGTGGSRKGSIKNPLYRGGGRIFGPQPRDYSFKLNKKVKALARKAVLTSKAQEQQILVVEDFTFDAPKTKSYRAFLEAVKLGERSLVDMKTLFLMDMPANPVPPKAPERPRKLRGAKNRALYMQSLKAYVAAIRVYRQEMKAYQESLAVFKNGEGKGYKNVWLSSRNLPKAEVVNARDFNIYQVMNADCLVLSERSVLRIQELLGKYDSAS